MKKILNLLFTDPSCRCVYFDESDQRWTSGGDICEVKNNLALQLDDYVECSCNHMSHYSVISTVSDPNIVGYNIWFYIACFISMVSIPMNLIHILRISTQTLFGHQDK